MKRFAILRDVPPDLDWDKVDASAIQNMMDMGMPAHERNIAWEPRVLGVAWVRSYWEPGSNWGTCLYEGPDEQAVRDWHDFCQVPYAGIREIEVEEDPSLSEAYPRGFHDPLDAPPLIAIEVARPASVEPDGYRRIRTYRFPDTGEELQLLLPPANVEVSPPPGGVVRRVVEIRPGDYQ